MKKVIISGLFLLVSATALADWTEQTVILDVKNVTDPGQIAQTLQYVKSFQDYLVSFELANPSKLVLNSISAHVSYYAWSNDSTCQVSNPGSVQAQRVESVSGSYYFAASPSAIQNVNMANGLSSPCNSMKN
jgi:hypothetical protein